jgi:plastocyanin
MTESPFSKDRRNRTVTINSQAQPKGRSTRSLAAVALALGLIALAGCGSSSSTSSSASKPETTPAATESTPTTSSAAGSAASESSGSTGSALSLEANPEGQLAYNTKSLSAKAGKVSIDFKNMSEVGHNVTVESSAGATEGATPTIQGESKTLSLNLKPGTYKFFCSVPGHRQAGMEGTITVK